MHIFYQEYCERLAALHTEIKQALSGLPDEALDWRPGQDANSLTVLVMHLTGAERYWIGDVVYGEPSGRDRAAEFRQSGLGAAALIGRLDATLAYAQAALERLSLADLEREVISPRDGKRFTVAWALLHALEHSAIHLGHIQLTRQMWDQAQGSKR